MEGKPGSKEGQLRETRRDGERGWKKGASLAYGGCARITSSSSSRTTSNAF